MLKNDMVEREIFALKENKEWFLHEYNTYIPSNIDSIKHLLTENTIEIFFGLWCSDSRREVPRLIKILDSINFKNYTLINLDENKRSVSGYENNKRITHVPIFIIQKNSIEIGRIVESPIETLESDLIKILSHQKYIPHYSSN